MPDNTQPTILARILGVEKGNFQGNEYYTLAVRIGEQVGDLTGVGTFDFTPYKDKDVLLTLELRKSAGRYKVRAASAETVA